MSNEGLFKEFLEEYLGNVKKRLPSSYRATQLAEGGTEANLVYVFETEFLKAPFEKAIRKVLEGEPRYSIDEFNKLMQVYVEEAIYKNYNGFADFFIWIQDTKKIRKILEGKQ